MVRWESVIAALFGTLAGLAVGASLGWVVVRAAGSSVGVFAVPGGPLAIVLIGGALAGLLAGMLPARRAPPPPPPPAVAPQERGAPGCCERGGSPIRRGGERPPPSACSAPAATRPPAPIPR